MNILLQPAADALRSDQRLLLQGVDWQTYEKFLEAVGERHLRLTYDRGNLELMAPSLNHEWWKRRLGCLMLPLAEELNVEIQGGGSTTFRREDLARGLEPDECFWIRHEPQIRGRREIDLTRDPPPDLVLEIDITTSFLDRIGIYAALGVPEIWCFDSESLRVYLLQGNRSYELRNQSLSFPFLPLAEFVRFLHQTEGLSETSLVRSFRTWLRAGLPTWQGAAPNPGSTSAPSGN
jgi:Uma2 family endonuclease